MGMIMRDAVTVLRAPMAGEFRKERDWASATSHEIAGCSFQPGFTGADLDEQRAYTEGASLYLREGSDIDAGDRVSFMGEVYEVVGLPLQMRSPSGRISHIRCELKRWS